MIDEYMILFAENMLVHTDSDSNPNEGEFCAL